MADEQEKILSIRVNYQEALDGITKYKNAIKELQETQKKLKGDLEDGRISQKEYDDQMQEAGAAIKVYQSDIRGLDKEIQNNIKIQEAQEGSLVQLRARLSNLTKEYDSLSRKERENGETGAALRKSINETTTQLKAAEEGTQRYYRNVGNYENAIKNTLGLQGQWFTQLQSLAGLMHGGLRQAAETVTVAIRGVGKELLALLANPVVAILAAVAAVFIALQKAVKSNEEAMRAWNRIMAPLEAILNVIINAVQTAAEWVVKYAESVGAAAMSVSRWAESLPIVGGLLKSVNDTIEENVELMKRQQALQDQERQNEVLNAKEALKVAQLRQQAAAASDPAERIKNIEEALKVEQRAMERERAMAKERYEIAKAKAEQTKNDKETNDELAKLEAAYYKTEADYVQGTIRMTSQLRSAKEQLARDEAAAQKARTDAAKKGAEERKRIMEEEMKLEQEAIKQANDLFIRLIKDAYEQRRAQIETSYDRQIQAIRDKLAKEKNLTETAIAEMNASISALYQLRADELKELERTTNEERLKQAIADEEKRLNLIIETTKKGSQAQYDARMALLQQQQDAATAEIEQSALNEEQKQERLSLIEQQYEQQRTELRVQQNQEAMAAAQQAFEEQIQQQTDNSLTQAELEMEQKKAALDALHQMEGESNDAFRARELEATKAYTEAKKKYDNVQMVSEVNKAKVIESTIGGMQKVMEQFGEENKAMAIASKMLALAQIAVSTGVAIAEGVKQAQSVPFPANIAAIATTVGTVLGNIASAISTVKSAKFAEGGLVTGEGTGTSDSIPAHLSNGESVMTAKATTMFAPLLSTLNQIGGGVPIPSQAVYTTPAATGSEGDGMVLLTESFKEAVSELPNPVVSVQEINATQNRVEVLEKLATI